MSFRLSTIDHLNRAHAIPLFMRMTVLHAFECSSIQTMLRLQPALNALQIVKGISALSQTWTEC